MISQLTQSHAETISEKLNDPFHPQLISLIVTVIIIFALSLTAYIKVKKVKPNEAPKGVALIAEAYIGGIESQLDDTFGNNLAKSRVYILTLGTFLLVGNLTTVLGFEPIVTSYSVPFTLALASWLGIFVCGAVYRKWKYLFQLINPLELVGKVSPLISLSFRIYGNIIGGSTVIFMIYALLGYLVGPTIPGSTSGPLVFFAPIITPALHFYFDLFGSTLQAYIFTLLTAVYWLVESGTAEEEKPKKSLLTKVKTYFNKKTKKVQVEPETVY
ncbi:F0F1 ATP synthase subunit A [Mycoplasma sp. NEAQ87857]|uniref:F0F1 ATP synthase subunit A n=1 Tax=Mycoplasma sp. NEAQ87857 TaxID=2683967 RepID=UPI001318AC4D|nr:F0F1 ATP synthase subunit A [Mycoplasma sp. NEAQ87857]QGZ97667.1 F0F1 ATP synthase subunit A [Mycoplasma sp. NEAQ87857]